MAKKQNITESQAKEWADNAMEACAQLISISEGISKCRVDDFDAESGQRIAWSLTIAARDASEAAARVLLHCEHSGVRRKLASMRGDLNVAVERE